jgi:type I restriction enzyme M protein
MPRKPRTTADEIPATAPDDERDEEALSAEGDADAPEEEVVCRITGEKYKRTREEEILQALVEQLEQEYGFDVRDMARDVSFSWSSFDEEKKKNRRATRRASLVVYDHGAKQKNDAAIIRVLVVAKKGTRAQEGRLPVLDDILLYLAEHRLDLFGAWTDGEQLHYRRLVEQAGFRQPDDIADFPGVDETLADLEQPDRRPLRIGTRESLVRAFKSCHDYLYGNQSMRADRAFWQILFLIFCKILDERRSSRQFYVGATEANTEAGRAKVVKRIQSLFKLAKDEMFKDVFDGPEQIELNDRALVFIVSELSRFSFLNSDTDAKGTAYETITASTLKRERGQFFTPRNVIHMMVEMMDPGPEHFVLDPACGSGGFLVVVLNHVRNKLLDKDGADPNRKPGEPILPVPRELKRIEPKIKEYAGTRIWGVDIDPDLRKAARMNMVMNDDGHANIFCFNSLEFGTSAPGEKDHAEIVRFVEKVSAARTATGPMLVAERALRELSERRDFGQFDFVFTNPPFGAKIPISDPAVLKTFDLGHDWTMEGGQWVKAGLKRKVPPEILFIEACFRMLKPGAGRMAIVLPDGILGNPGRQMDAVRAWMLREMELLASVDLPGETFLPQVSIQASCVFLRRRDPSEALGKQSQNQVFMAIAEKVGHGRRDERVYLRGTDGQLRTFDEESRYRSERSGRVDERRTEHKVARIADDLPWISEQYRKYVAKIPFEGS